MTTGEAYAAADSSIMPIAIMLSISRSSVSHKTSGNEYALTLTGAEVMSWITCSLTLVKISL